MNSSTHTFTGAQIEWARIENSAIGVHYMKRTETKAVTYKQNVRCVVFLHAYKAQTLCSSARESSGESYRRPRVCVRNRCDSRCHCQKCMVPVHGHGIGWNLLWWFWFNVTNMLTLGKRQNRIESQMQREMDLYKSDKTVPPRRSFCATTDRKFTAVNSSAIHLFPSRIYSIFCCSVSPIFRRGIFREARWT